MLNQSFLTDSLVSQVQTTALSPNSQNQFQTSQILALMNNELKLNICSMIKSVIEEYFVTSLQYQVNAGQSYQIPIRCMGGSLRQVVLVDAAGQWVDITKMALEDIVVTSYNFYTLPIWNYGFYLMNDRAFLYPQGGNSQMAYTLQMNYERMPNDLVSSDVCGQINAVNMGTNTLTLSFVDPSWTTGSTFDIIDNQPQFSSVGDDQTITNISGNDVTFTNLPTGVHAGQWVCLAGQSCIPQIPYSLFPLLVYRTVYKMAQALGDSTLLQTAKDSYTEAREDALHMLTPRMESENKIIQNKNKGFLGYNYGLPFSR